VDEASDCEARETAKGSPYALQYLAAEARPFQELLAMVVSWESS
jgi:hypothetical protein